MHVAHGPLYELMAAFCAALSGAHVSWLLFRFRSETWRVLKTPAGSDVSWLFHRYRPSSCVRVSKTPAGSDVSWCQRTKIATHTLHL